VCANQVRCRESGVVISWMMPLDKTRATDDELERLQAIMYIRTLYLVSTAAATRAAFRR
jgi:hypothetical protein